MLGITPSEDVLLFWKSTDMCCVCIGIFKHFEVGWVRKWRWWGEESHSCGFPDGRTHSAVIVSHLDWIWVRRDLLPHAAPQPVLIVTFWQVVLIGCIALKFKAMHPPITDNDIPKHVSFHCEFLFLLLYLPSYHVAYLFLFISIQFENELINLKLAWERS